MGDAAALALAVEMSIARVGAGAYRSAELPTRLSRIANPKDRGLLTAPTAAKQKQLEHRQLQLQPVDPLEQLRQELVGPPVPRRTGEPHYPLLSCERPEPPQKLCTTLVEPKTQAIVRAHKERPVQVLLHQRQPEEV